MPTTSIVFQGSPLAHYVLARADDALVLGHRLSEWCGHAPMLEEDLALTNIALDLIGQARALYTYAAELEGKGHDEDDLAYLREDRHFHNLLLLEQPNGDFAVTCVRLLLFSAFAEPYWQLMQSSSDSQLAAIAAKAEKECAYHLRHASQWVIRLGDGTEESHRRTQNALDALWIYTGELFETSGDEQALIAQGIAADPEAIRPIWQNTVTAVLMEATLQVPSVSWMQTGGRRGLHSEHLGHMLAEMQYLQRTYPGAEW